MMGAAQWIADVHSTAGINEGKIIGPAYTTQLVKGREPGTLPPIAPLIKWVEIKFNKQGDEAKGIAWAIAKKIEKSGTTYYEQGGTNLLEVLDEPRTLQFIQDELGGIARIKVAEELTRNAIEALT